MRKQITTIFMLAAAVGIAAIGVAADKASPAMKMAATSSPMKSVKNSQAYLGVGVESLPEALISQLPSELGEGCGVLVSEVAVGSPAEKAGLKANDVLVSYDNQRLYSPEQFVKLVRYDKPERHVKLGLVHDGKPADIEVALGERSSTIGEQEYGMGRHFPMSIRAQRPMTTEEEDARWSSFDSLTLSRTDKDHFKAEIKYRDDKGKLETRDFQGSREQLRKDIDAEKDLPMNEREQLLCDFSIAEPVGGCFSVCGVYAWQRRFVGFY